MATRKPTAKEGGKKKTAPPAVKKVCKGKRSDHLVDEEDEEPQPASEPQVEDDEYKFQRVVEGKGKGIASDELRRTPVTQDTSTGPSAQPQDDTSANVVRDTPSPADAETGADTEKSTSKADTKIFYNDEEHGEEVSHTVDLKDRTVELDEGQAGLDPSKTLKSLPPPECVLMEEDQLDQTLDKHTTEEHVHIENPLSSSGTLSSMKNLDDAFTFGDQFLNNKPTEEEPCKANMETKVESMETIPIH
ncbi:hypothetical protein Tco_1031717 [Tanacetum coccineum]|uniref:Uncharacterized protein n=1 Tax=Tanacetum coccineum TaxID=301880 RepID=A0ABQ5GB65_9ASTR